MNLTCGASASEGRRRAENMNEQVMGGYSTQEVYMPT